MDVAGFDIIIPFFPVRGRYDEHVSRVLSFLQSLEADPKRVHVLGDTGECTSLLPPKVKSTSIPLVDEPDSPLPRGWLAAALHMAGSGRGTVIVDYNQMETVLDLIPRVVAALKSGSSPVVIAVESTEDHPCQFNMYFNVLRNEIFVVADNLADDVRIQCSRLLPHASAIIVSKPFFFVWEGRMLDSNNPDGLYRIVNATIEGGLAKVVPGNGEQVPCERNVFLWFENVGMARQVVVNKQPLGAMPLMLPSHLTGIRIENRNSTWTIFGKTVGDGPNHIQLFPETFQDVAQSMATAVRAHAVLPFSAPSEIGVYDWTCTVSALENTALFIVNILEEARPPYADMELPYVPTKPAWHVDSMTLKRTLAGSERVINSRQDFPEILHPAGGIIAFSENAMADPLAAMRKENALATCLVSRRKLG